MRILLTGSSGLLGREIGTQLSSAAHQVVGLDLVPGSWTTHVGSVIDRDIVTTAMQGIDAVIHTASLHAPDVPRRTRREFIAVNVEGTLNVLEAAISAGVRRVVYTSTTSLYGDALVHTDRAVWVTEDLPPRPRDIYDITKLTAEQLCADVARSGGPAAISLRTGRFFPEPDETVAIHRLSRGLDIRDAAYAHLLAVENESIAFGVYNISARSPFALSECPELLTDAAAVIRRHFPWADDEFTRRGWALPRTIDRVYVTYRAESDLGGRAQLNFAGLFNRQPSA